jgi:calcineurin-like phosphoesterase family protein
MTAWYTADLHFGHANIIAYSGRPFADADAMNGALIDRWNAAVHPDDTVWVLGDVALGRIDESLGLVALLNGDKRLLAGNHDRCWSGHGRRAAGWTERYLAAGFAEVHQGQIAIAVGGRRVRACHFPYRGDSHDHDRYVAERPVDRGDWLLHGHVHERWRQRGRMINVGVDAWGCGPVDETALAALINDGPNDLAPLPSSPSRAVIDTASPGSIGVGRPGSAVRSSQMRDDLTTDRCGVESARQERGPRRAAAVQLSRARPAPA